MNHIRKLTEQRDTARLVNNLAYAGLDALLAYLQTSKFHDDNTIQVRTDLWPRLMDIRNILLSDDILPINSGE